MRVPLSRLQVAPPFLAPSAPNGELLGLLSSRPRPLSPFTTSQMPLALPANLVSTMRADELGLTGLVL